MSILPLLLAAPLFLGSAAPGDRLFVSPMGELFVGSKDAPPDASWFAGADTNGDGKLTQDEMLADASRFFRTLNADGNAEIDPQEMERYEMGLMQAIGSRGRGSARDRSVDGPDSLSDAPPGPSRYVGRGAVARFNYFGLQQPVLSADTNFNRGVSGPEFARAAMTRFAALDTNHDGVVARGELPKAPR